MRARAADTWDEPSVPEMTAPRYPTATVRALAARIRSPRARRPLIAAIAATVLALATWGALHSVDPGHVRQSFADVSWPWIVAAAAAYAATQIVSALVWSVGLSAGGLGEIGRGHVLRAHLLGRGACELLPAHLGETVRFAAIRRHPAACGGGMRIAGSMGAFKVVDGVVTFAVVAAAAVVAPLPDGASGVRWLAGGMLVGLILAAIALWKLGPTRLARLVPVRARGVVEALGRGAALLASGRAMAAAAGLQLVAIGFRVLSLAALLAAFGLPPGAAPLVFGLMILTGYLAISPGGAGVREAALVPVLVATYGLGAAPALAFSLGVQAIALAVSLLGALVALLLQRRIAHLTPRMATA